MLCSVFNLTAWQTQGFLNICSQVVDARLISTTIFDVCSVISSDIMALEVSQLASKYAINLNGKIARIGDHSVSFGGFADVWEGL